MAFLTGASMIANVDNQNQSAVSLQQLLMQQQLGMADYYNHTHAQTTAASANTTNIYVTPYQLQPSPMPVALKPLDEFSWLRKRVEDVCWR